MRNVFNTPRDPYEDKKKPKPERDYSGQAKTRICLKCRRSFFSEWIGQRICGSCKDTGIFGSMVAESYSVGHK